MIDLAADTSPVRAGDVRGLGSIYDGQGELIKNAAERIIRKATGWEIDVMSPWRRILPKTLFEGLRGLSASKLYLTSTRIVLIRDIDAWREVSGDMNVLGMPNAVAREARLRELKRAGARQYCEVYPDNLRLVSSRRFVRRGSMIDLRLLSLDGRQFAIAFWKTDGKDDETLDAIGSQFHPR